MAQHLTPQRDEDQPCPFAVRLNQLFATTLAPEGRPYTLAEVSRATGLAVPYLSMLRKGVIAAVPFQRVVALARFFHVPLASFCPGEPPAETLEADVQEALAQPLARELLLRAARLSLAQRALILAVLYHLAGDDAPVCRPGGAVPRGAVSPETPGRLSSPARTPPPSRDQ